MTKAWPAVGARKPKTRVDRWLARQVGPKPTRVCATLPKKLRSACRASATPAATRRVLASVPTGEGMLARMAAISTGVRLAPTANGPLQLLRSYEIPKDDPSYDRLLNWSWTYDSAVAAAAFAVHGDQRQAQRLLDQLTVLQGRDGSIDFAFNVSTGEGAAYISSGTVAWVGLAAVMYDSAYSSDRYQATAKRAARYLLSLRRPEDGLISGGPGIKWASTLHNLVTYELLQGLGSWDNQKLSQASRLQGLARPSGSARWSMLAEQLGETIDSQLLVQDDNGAHFKEGAGDDGQALDVQAIGSLYLGSRGQEDVGRQVLDGAEQAYAVSDRSISLNKRRKHYNETYQDNGPFQGFRPYLGNVAPDVLTFEGSAQMRLAMMAYGEDTSALDESMGRWVQITGNGQSAPLGSDQTELSPAFGDYHVWPTGAAAAWGVLSGASPTFYIAPLPGDTTLVTSWPYASGGGISMSSDGRVEMMEPYGERQILAGSGGDGDYTVSADAQLVSGSDYGVLVRASADGNGISGYEVRFDAADGALFLRQWVNGQPLAAPLAGVGLGLDWNAQHTISVTVQGNSLSASVDGSDVLDVGDLAGASADAAANSGVEGVSPPSSGMYGLRTSDGSQAVFPQFTVAGVVLPT